MAHFNLILFGFLVLLCGNTAQEDELLLNDRLQDFETINVDSEELNTAAENNKRSNSNIRRARGNQENIFSVVSIRSKRYAQRPDQTAALRKRLQAEKKREEMMNDPRVEPNYTGNPIMNTSMDPRFGGVNKEQRRNSAHDTLRQLITTQRKEILNSVSSESECDFESECTWKWKTDIQNGFSVAYAGSSGQNDTGPSADASNNAKGHYLLLHLLSTTKELHVRSPVFNSSRDTCRVQFWIYQESMGTGEVRIVVDANNTQWVADKIIGDDSRRWIKHEKAIGKISQNFSIIIEVVPLWSAKGGTIAFDNIKLVQCFPEVDNFLICTPPQFRCSTSNKCIKRSQICDITQDCIDGEDENQNCDAMPPGARCNFEQDWCGWYSVEEKLLQWIRHNGSTPTNKTGPNFDHTYKNTTGKYLYVNMATKGAEFANSATLKSVIFNPPPSVHGNISSPYYNSCMVRFYLHQTGYHRSAVQLQVTELKRSENISKSIFWSNNNHGDEWVRQVVVLPNITHKYYLHFDAKKGIRYIMDIAIDDISLSPECFGLNIPESELNGYNYWNPSDEHTSSKEPHVDFVNQTVYEVTTCNATGRFGPSQSECSEAYKNTKVKVKVLHEAGLSGVQKWAAPNEGFYTFILNGASGGKGSGGMGSSRGAMVRLVVELNKGQQFYILVGQEGTNACLKTLGHRPQNTSCISQKNEKNLTLIRAVLHMELTDGGGGGGGATFLFYRNESSHLTPLAVAAGGGGLGLSQFNDNGLQHGQAINMSLPPTTGNMYGLQSGGSGGGWKMFQGKVTEDQRMIMGGALLMGAIGGKACYNSSDGRGDGGFGGGGGGCISGGGGGGYTGGNSVLRMNSTNGEGGYSFLDPSRTIPSLSEAHSGYNAGRGSVLILPAVPGCGCAYRCLALDARRSQVACICPTNWKLDIDGKSCIPLDSTENFPAWFVMGLIITIIFLLMAFGIIFFILYNRYQQKKSGILRRKMLSGADLQLNRLRVASDSMMTEYNPSYEFGGVVYTLKDLKDIPRDQLRLVKALGQGAFGEVYQGFYRQRSGDTVEMPVAVKTLPEMSTSQAEMDFLMEALIMSKFHHANIVHFIGVCFDKHPRFIVLELLAGGDLKNFLREARPKPPGQTFRDKTPQLTMKDLVFISVDVAKGCRYLEENRFIHRDIAARNCLLTTKGPGRVVKIADFGMSRDVYRSDYYRKGGKAMLPIKWMPPEAFLDGIFTTKTDVWSFGVLLWEILSLGYMPYPGCANREVMQLVTSGGRLEPPTSCPGPIYAIMTQCWHPTPDQRPTFALILERLHYCIQDTQVMDTPLPVFSRPPSHERDATVMRPHNSNDNCLQVIPQTTDYLIPNHTNFTALPNSVGSTSSVDKLLPENSDSWETSFVMPHSRSTQPLLQDTELNTSEGAGSIEKLLIDNNISKPAPLPNNVLKNHNNNVKAQPENSLKSGISLDASALIKQNMPPAQKKSYANLNTSNSLPSNGVLQNGPFSVQNQNNFINSATNANKFLNDSEISC